ncbi:calcium/sodium antiporter [bacterium]|nr:calcium/sodium antiporter [bacterium]
MTITLLCAGLAALVTGAELLVRGASRLAAAVGISPLVVGLTVVAFGTSAPELAVSVSSACAGQADLAVGNVVGSNIFNVLFILGLSALITPLVVDQKLVRVDVPLMIGASLLMLVAGSDQIIGRLEGGLLFGGLLAFTSHCIVAGRKAVAADRSVQNAEVPMAGTLHVSCEPQSTMPSPVGASLAGHARQVGLIVLGLALLVVGSNWLVEGATELARWLGVSELMIGLTIVAGGTSLPEVATSIIAALRGERDIAVGNVVGSNLFNILGVLGLTALVAPSGVAVPSQTLSFDIPVMIAVAAACLPIFFTGHLIARWEGAVFLVYYTAYMTTLVLTARSHDALPAFQQLMLIFAVPLTVATLLIFAFREFRLRSAETTAT